MREAFKIWGAVLGFPLLIALVIFLAFPWVRKWGNAYLMWVDQSEPGITCLKRWDDGTWRCNRAND